MKLPVPSSTLTRVIGMFALLLLQFGRPALANDNWEVGKRLHDEKACASCHSAHVGKTAADIAYAITTQPDMHRFRPIPLGTDPLTSDQISDLGAYLTKPVFPVAELRAAPTGDFGAVSVDSAVSRSFNLRNAGDAPLIVNSMRVDDATNFTVSSSCTSIPIAPGTTCAIQVTFAPRSVGAFNGRTLTIGHDAIGDGTSSTATPPRFTSSLTLSGTGLAPFTVAPGSPMSFTPATAPAGTRTVTITDNKGDRIRICRAEAIRFNAFKDFSLDAPASFGAGDCFTTSQTGTVPRQISLVVRFAPGAPGPRFAKLTFQRLDNASNALGPVTTLQLEGNPGGVAMLNASSLFDEVDDPGVEVDGDATLARMVTISSQGTEPLQFNSSTFSITGPSSSEYTLAETGCKTLATPLPAFTSGPAPSCILTVVFNPSDVGRRGPAILSIRFPDVADNVVTLDGLGIRGPRLAVQRGVASLTSGDTLQFSTQTIGGIYPSVPITLTNGGTQGSLEVTLPTAGSTPGFSFSNPAACGQLPPAASCVIGLHFDPVATQGYAALLQIQTRPVGTSEAVKTFQLNLQGQGSASVIPRLSWIDSSGMPITKITFADTAAGTPVTTRVRLHNAGPGGARLRFGNVIGLGAINFALDVLKCDDGFELYEGMSCEVALTFAPSSAGPKSASAQYVAEAGTPPVVVLASDLALIGTSIAQASPARLQPSASTVQFPNTVIGSSATPAELRLTNNGSRALNVLNFDVGAPFGLQARTCASLPFLLAPGAECAVSLTFQPQAEGRATGRLRITTDTTPAILEVPLEGTGQAQANVSSGGGCSMASGDTLTDPTLWALVVLALAALRYRHRARSAARHRP